MKKITLAVAIVVANIMACFASDPGGMPGLVKATFKGSSFDSTSDVMANAQECVVSPEEMYATSLPEKTTVAWAGYMKMEGGVTYEFKGYYDDFVTVKIAGTWVLSKGDECQERTGSYTPATTDWYSIEFRVANNGGGGGCQNILQYGILWKKSTDKEWCRIRLCDTEGELLFKTGRSDIKLVHTVPIILSCQVRGNDPTILDVKYIVYSQNPTVNVCALAFQDGERSFFKVVRPETFVKDSNGNETAQNIGDNIAANVEYSLSWKVSADWAVDLAKMKFEILLSDQGKLPLDLITIPAANNNPAITVSYNNQTAANVFNALLWYWANGEEDLMLNDGFLYCGNEELAHSTDISHIVYAITYVFKKMGYEGLSGEVLNYVIGATRKELRFNSSQYNVLRKDVLKGSLYIGQKAYCVVDISGGTSAMSYPVTYLDSCPLSGWSDEYKTTKILLRRIEPGEVKVGGTKPVTLTKAFYMGVFEVTQEQYKLVTGKEPSSCKGNMRPVEMVSWNDIRGDSGTYDWPNVKIVDSASFIGILQTKTGLKIDLPTESQWEYACRAGTTSLYNNGGSNDYDLKMLGRYSDNRSDSRGGYGEHTTVGSYTPNVWGLYDMHGNITEWCLDWYGDLNGNPITDWIGASSGSSRVARGGDWRSTIRFEKMLNSSGRIYGGSSERANSWGFRLSRTIEE